MDENTQHRYTSREKRLILEKIGKLSHTEHEEIFKIVNTHDIPYTQNKNGLFINMNLVSDEILQSVDRFVEFCMKNKSELDEYDQRIIECKLHNNFDALERTTERKQLSDIIAPNNTYKTQEDWHKMLVEAKADERIANFATMLEDNIEKIHKKKGNMKYVNAKKKYARRVTAVADKKTDSDMSNILEIESYLL